VSIFVNPTQFGPGEDFERYPRDLEADRRICEQAGVELVFAPGVKDMYPDRNLTLVTVEELTTGLCGRFRPGHFRGVTTVCNKLFNIVRPDVAFFGQKDAQQAIVIKRMVADTNLPLEIVVCPTVREPDGLAMSSRNQYLSPDERKDAVLLYRALAAAETMIERGERNCARLVDAMSAILNSSGRVSVEYVSIADVETLAELAVIRDKALIAVAARVGKTRLIDNTIVNLNKHAGLV
jgi:pantoate--beta-alanine ligase